MKLNEILNLSKWKSPVQNAAALINEKCQPFLLSDWKDGENIFYRSVRNIKGVYREVDIRTDRKPSNTPASVHNALVEAVIKAAKSQGVPDYNNVANRHNSAFCQLNGINLIYGDPFLFFPVGEYRTTYIKGVRDMFTVMPTKMRYDEPDQDMINNFIKKLVKEKFFVFDSIDGIEREEVMVKASSGIYVAHRHEEEIISAINELQNKGNV